MLSLTVTSFLVQQQLSFSSSGGMGKAATVTYQRLASLSNKWNSSYSVIMAGIGSAVVLASPCFALR